MRFTIFETNAEMCKQTFIEKIEAMLTTLRDNAQKHFTKQTSSCHNFEKAKEIFRTMYLYHEKVLQICTFAEEENFRSNGIRMEFFRN